MPQEIWTSDVRRVLYARLKALFGPLDAWDGSNSPGRNLDKKFQSFCEAFAHVVGADTAKAVQMQVRFSMPETAAGSNWEKGHVRTAILNKAAALEVGFITNKHLPKRLQAKGGYDLEDLA